MTGYGSRKCKFDYKEYTVEIKLFNNNRTSNISEKLMK